MKRRARYWPPASHVSDAWLRHRLTLILLIMTGGTNGGNVQAMPQPIVDAETGQMYGAIDQARWISPELIRPGTVESLVFAHYGPEGTRGGNTRLRSVPTDETCSNPTFRPVAAKAGAEPGSYLAAEWNTAPRTALRLDRDNAGYRAVLSQWLTGHEITDPSPRLEQLLRVDLDGDGRDEIILAAERHRGSVTSTRAGDYSVLLLRAWKDGSVVTLPVRADLYPQDCLAECAPARYRVFSILDLNGDGRLEMIVTRRDYEAVGRAIYSLDDWEQPRLQWRCGP